MTASPGKVACPACKKEYTFRADLAGKRVKCSKCGGGFLMNAPAPTAGVQFETVPPVDAGEYDVTPEPVRSQPPAPRRPVLAPEPLNRAGRTKAEQHAAETGSLVQSTINLTARHGVAGLAVGVIFGGLFKFVRHKPGAAKTIVRVIVGGILGIILLLIGVSVFFTYRHPFSPVSHTPTLPPPQAFVPPREPGMPVGPPAGVAGGPPPESADNISHPTYESLVQQFGKENVVRLTVIGVKNPQRDKAIVQGLLGMRGPGSWTLDDKGDRFDCVFAPPMPFDSLTHMVSWGAIETLDAKEKTITVKMNLP